MPGMFQKRNTEVTGHFLVVPISAGVDSTLIAGLCQTYHIGEQWGIVVYILIAILQKHNRLIIIETDNMHNSYFEAI